MACLNLCDKGSTRTRVARLLISSTELADLTQLATESVGFPSNTAGALYAINYKGRQVRTEFYQHV